MAKYRHRDYGEFSLRFSLSLVDSQNRFTVDLFFDSFYFFIFYSNFVFFFFETKFYFSVEFFWFLLFCGLVADARISAINEHSIGVYWKRERDL